MCPPTIANRFHSVKSNFSRVSAAAGCLPSTMSKAPAACTCPNSCAKHCFHTSVPRVLPHIQEIGGGWTLGPRPLKRLYCLATLAALDAN